MAAASPSPSGPVTSTAEAIARMEAIDAATPGPGQAPGSTEAGAAFG